MAYADQANRPDPAALFGAFGIPAAVGAVLIAGLAVTVLPDKPDDTLIGVNLPDIPDIEPIPEPEKATETTSKTTQQAPSETESVLIIPKSELDLGESAPITSLPPIDGDILGKLDPIDIGPDVSAPIATLDPVAAAPRGNPGRWITTRDYRSSWINRGLTGRAGFALTIDAEGRVTDCTITRSTGHDALDEATCRLLEKRASFTPARDGAGDPVAGTYSSSVNWQIP